ncbi:hypothetical protein llg_00360 [Luteolibacter sp. LG18]|nr:hypothetical protein llg_00360 [Luteolibacter sp. LG18]
MYIPNYQIVTRLGALLIASISVSVGEDLPKSRPSQNDFEESVFEFYQFSAVPLKTDQLNNPTNTREIYLNRGRGITEVIVFGFMADKWIGFRTRTYPDLDHGTVLVKFDKIEKPDASRSSEIDSAWQAYIQGIKASIPKDGDRTTGPSPVSKAFERTGSNPKLVCEAKAFRFTSDDEGAGKKLEEMIRLLGLKPFATYENPPEGKDDGTR